jgi:diguanylate cyclase (GGDEF)-like protein/PAS domain S-box-containing protein
VLINRTKSGERYYEEKTITPLKNADGVITHYVSTGKDITSRMAADEERERLVAILEATTDFVAIATVEGEIVYLNRAARRCLGRSEAEKLSHLMLSEIYPEWARALVMGEGIPAAVRGGVWHGETAVLNRNGDEIPISQLFLAHRTPAGEVEFLSTIARDISDRKAQTAGLEYRATHDPLTTLPNRALFFDRLRYTLLAAQREKSSFALFIIDLDRFKQINDSHGHYAGDLVLKEVALRLQEALRESDTVARIGGDEFAVILPNVDLSGGRRAAEKILATLARPMDEGEISLPLRASIGMTLFPDHGSDLDDLVRRADEIMYSAKRAGGGYEIYASKNETSG